MKFSRGRSAFKYCDVNGSWWTHPLTNKTWSNYTNCVDFEDLNFRNTVNDLSLFGLGLSLSCLLLSLVIFSMFQSLSCNRVSVHKNLFFSLVFNNISWIVWYYFVLFDLDVLSSNEVWCRILHVITTFFTLTTYFWMFCEGIYLQLLLDSTLQVDQNWMILLCLSGIGWVAPAILLIPYVIYRLLYENENCWMDMGDSNWFLGIPVIIVIIFNIILINVIHILLSKLNPAESDERTEQARM